MLENLIGTISFLGSPFVKANLWRIWSLIIIFLWQKIISNTSDVFLFSWFCLGLYEKSVTNFNDVKLLKWATWAHRASSLQFLTYFENFICCFFNLSMSCLHRTSKEANRNIFQIHPIVTVNLLKPTGYVMHEQFNIQQLYALPKQYLCVLYLSENKQRLVPLTA